MGNTVSGKIIKALGKLALKPEDVGRAPTAYVHMRPSADELSTVIEVIDGRGYLRADVAGECDEGVLFDRDALDHVMPDDELLVEGNELRFAGLRRALDKSDGSTPAQVTYPDCEPHRVDASARVAFSIAPKRLANFLNAIAACDCKSVEVLLPKTRGGPIAFRGEMKNGRGIEGIMVAESLFNATAEDVAPGVAGALSAPMQALPAPGPLANRARPGDGLPFTESFLCANDGIAIWMMPDGSTIVACETHREELTPDGFVQADVLQPGTAKCQHAGIAADAAA